MKQIERRLQAQEQRRMRQDGAHGCRTAIRFAGGTVYLIPEGQTTEKYPNENACISAGLETVKEDDPRNIIVFDYVPSVVNARPGSGKSDADIEAEIDAAAAYWGDVIIIDR